MDRRCLRCDGAKVGQLLEVSFEPKKGGGRHATPAVQCHCSTLTRSSGFQVWS